MDPSQSDSLMKLPVSLEQDSLLYDTCVIIDSTATVSFVSHISLNQIGLVGKRVRGPKIVVHYARG